MYSDDGRVAPANEDVRAGVVPDAADTAAMPSIFQYMADDLLVAASEIDTDLADRSLYVRQLLACRGGPGNTSANARKALAHWRLKHNELASDRLSIETALADEVEALQAPMVGLLRQLLKVEVLRLDLDRAIEAEARYAAKRDREERIGLYEAARTVVDRLFEDHRIADGHWYAITEEGLPALRDVIEQEAARAGLGTPLQPAIRNKRRAKRSR